MTPVDRSRLASVRTIDLTTTGRKTGEPRRIEIWWFHVEGRFVITGTPGRRDWMANVLADPRVTIRAGRIGFTARVVPVDDPGFRRRVFTHPETSWYSTQAELERLVATAPMVEVVFPD
ncbi:MAG TPA: nitroreductase family deazaflavin-dependent oxidoreductase [Acidimicrobiia bacterium]|nr:nitroreductase family deazaflavin-dependent oxidoreductase [Acidimicrobiia bacterium]